MATGAWCTGQKSGRAATSSGMLTPPPQHTDPTHLMGILKRGHRRLVRQAEVRPGSHILWNAYPSPSPPASTQTPPT